MESQKESNAKIKDVPHIEADKKTHARGENNTKIAPLHARQARAQKKKKKRKKKNQIHPAPESELAIVKTPSTQLPAESKQTDIVQLAEEPAEKVRQRGRLIRARTMSQDGQMFENIIWTEQVRAEIYRDPHKIHSRIDCAIACVQLDSGISPKKKPTARCMCSSSESIAAADCCLALRPDSLYWRACRRVLVTQGSPIPTLNLSDSHTNA